jgi:hypothetical protein
MKILNRLELLMKTVNQDMKRPRMGRPRENPESVRSNRVVTFVTNSELTNLERIADEKGISISAVVHQILSGFLKDT